MSLLLKSLYDFFPLCWTLNLSLGCSHFLTVTPGLFKSVLVKRIITPMLNLVEARSLLQVIWLCWNASEHSPPRSTVLRHHEGPQGGMLEQQRVEAARQRSILLVYPGRSACLWSWKQPQISWDKCIQEVMRKKHPSSPLPSDLGEATAWCLKKKFCYGNPAMHIGIERCDAECKGKKDQAHQEQASFLDGNLTPIPKNHRGISIDFSPLCKLSLNCTLHQYKFSL